MIAEAEFAGLRMDVGDGVDAVDDDVEMGVVGVGVQAVDDLVVPDLHFVEEDVDRLLDLGGRRVLVLAPAEDEVLDRVGAPDAELGQRDHLGGLCRREPGVEDCACP